MTGLGRYTAEDFLCEWRTQMIDVAPDGTRMLVQSGESGTLQLSEIDLAPAARGERRKRTLTTGPTEVYGRYLADGRLVVQTDDHGDRRYRLSLRERDGAQRSLSRPEEVSCRLADVRPGGTLIACLANERSAYDFDVHLLDPDTGARGAVYVQGGAVDVVRFSPNGRHLLLRRVEAAPMDSNIILIDLADGTARSMTPHEEPAFAGVPAWLPDSSGFLFSSNRDSDFRRFVHVDLVDGVSGWSYDADGDIEAIVPYSPTGGVFTVNEAGVHSLYRYERGDPPVELRLPDRGVVSTYVPDPQLAGDDLLVNVTTPVESGDVWRMPLRGGSAERLTRSRRRVPIHRMAGPERHYVPTADGERVPVLLYLPQGVPDASWPTVINLHGGPEAQVLLGCNPLTQLLVSRGYAVAQPDVRGSTGYGKRYYGLDDGPRRLDTLRDLAALHGWLVGRGADPGRISLLGSSYGGYLTLLAIALQPAMWSAGISIGGISNLVTFIERTAPYRRRNRELQYGSPAEDREFLDKASPLTHIASISCPVLLLHGRNDPWVPVTESEQIAAALRGRGVPADLVVYPDEGHGITTFANRCHAYDRIVAFLDGTGRRP